MSNLNIISSMGIPFLKFLKNSLLLAVMGCVPFVAQTQTLPDNISNATCFITPPAGVWSIKENWKSTALMNVCRPVLLGDLDNDKLPEIVAWGNNLTGEAGVSVGDECTKLIVYPGNNRNSALSINTQPFGSYYTVSPFVLVKVGGKGLIIISGLDGYLYAYDYPRSSATHLWKSDQKVVAVTDKFDALYNKTGPSLNVADFNGDGVPEVYSGNKIFNAQTGKFIVSAAAALTDATIGTTVPNRGFSVQNATDNGSTLSFAADIDNDGKLELIVGNQIFKVANTDGTFKNPITLYKSIKPPKITSGVQCDNDGHVSVADFNNDGSLDVLVSLIHKNTDAVVYGWDVKNNTLLFSYDVAASSQSFPFIGNIDANKNLEIMMITQATTGVTEAYLRALKLPTTFSPTAKLSSFWTLKVDESSGRTGITLFDFNQDGISELVYRDMTTLRIIDGSTNPPTQKTTYPNLFSPTTWEYPIVADVDGDGEAEIVTSGATSNINMGNLYIYKSNGSKWAPARSVWNQYSYNAVNVNEDLTIPPSQMNPATVFPGIGGVLGDGNDVRPYNGFLMQQTFLNKNGTPLFLAPHATIPSQPILNYNPTSGAMSISVTVKNNGNAALQAPFYVTVYKNTVGDATKYTYTHSSNINAGSSVVITFSIPAPTFKTWLPFTNIVVRANDKGNGLSDQAVCSETGRDFTAKTVEFKAGLLNGPQDICINNKPYAFNSSVAPTGGTGTYTYEWESSPNDATWTVIAGANSENYAPGVLTTTTYYRRKVTSGIYGTVITPSVKVTVNPLPTNFPDVEALPICQNTILRITYIIRNASTKYNYSLIDPQGASSNIPSVDGDLTFLGSVYDGLSNGGVPGKKTYTISMYDKETKCTGFKLLPDLLTVYPLPIPDPISDKEFCVGAASVAFSGPDVDPAKCTWTNSNTAIGLAASGTGNLSFTATNNTNAPITAKITMIAVSDKDCAVPNAKTFNITINPTPVLPTITAAVVCVGVKPAFVISDANTAYEYMIYNPAGVAASNYMTPAANGSLTIATFNAEATGTASTSGTKVYKVQVRNKTTKCINTKTVNVVVSPLLVGGTTAGTTAICYNTSSVLSVAGFAGGNGTPTYQWQSSPDNVTWTNIASATAVGYTTPNLTTVMYYRRNTTNTCGTVSSISIKVTPYNNLVGGTTAGTTAICYNTSSVLSVTGFAGGVGTPTYQWQSSPDDVTWTNIASATAVGYTTPNLTTAMYYLRKTTNTCGTVSSTSIKVTPYLNLVGGTTAGTTAICYNTSSVLGVSSRH